MPSPVTAADYLGLVPVVAVSCPDDTEKVKAADLRNAVAALLANDDNLDDTKVAKAGDTMTGALTITPTGSGSALIVTGGTPPGAAVTITGGAPNGAGLSVEGVGSGFAAGFVGGPTGFGIIAQAGGSNQPGVKAQGDGTGADIECLGGPILFAGTQPAATAAPGANRQHATNVVKAWGVVQTDGAGGVTLLGGFNVASVSIASTVLTVNFATPMADNNYTASPSDQSTPISQATRVFARDRATSSASSMKIYGRLIADSGGTTVTNIDLTTSAVIIEFTVLGRQ